MPRTVIGSETRVRGALTGQDDLVIEGTVDGPVTGDAMVTVAAGAKVGGEVRGRDVVVGGVLRHPIHGTATVRLLATAEVFADITAPRIAIDEGAQFEGQVRRVRASATSNSHTEPYVSTPAPPTAPYVAPAATRSIPSLPPVGKKKLVRRTP